jgi:hypothetical protein
MLKHFPLLDQIPDRLTAENLDATYEAYEGALRAQTMDQSAIIKDQSAIKAPMLDVYSDRLIEDRNKKVNLEQFEKKFSLSEEKEKERTQDDQLDLDKLEKMFDPDTEKEVDLDKIEGMLKSQPPLQVQKEEVTEERKELPQPATVTTEQIVNVLLEAVNAAKRASYSNITQWGVKFYGDGEAAQKMRGDKGMLKKERINATIGVGDKKKTIDLADLHTLNGRSEVTQQLKNMQLREKVQIDFSGPSCNDSTQQQFRQQSSLTIQNVVQNKKTGEKQRQQKNAFFVEITAQQGGGQQM